MRKNEYTLKEALGEMVKNSVLKPKLNELRLQNIWIETMGKTISGYTQKIFLQKGKLYITISSAPLKQELSYGKEKIKHLLNESFGNQVVEEVIIL